MKCWAIIDPDAGGVFVHAESAGKARFAGGEQLGCSFREFLSLRVLREPAFDNLDRYPTDEEMHTKSRHILASCYRCEQLQQKGTAVHYRYDRNLFCCDCWVRIGGRP